MSDKYDYLKSWSNEHITEVDADDNNELSAVKFVEYWRRLKEKKAEEEAKKKAEVEEERQRAEDAKRRAEAEVRCQTEEEAEKWRAEELHTEKARKEAEELAKKRVSGNSTALTMY